MDSHYGFIADVDLWFRLAMRFDVGYIAKPLIICRQREEEHQYAKFNWEITQKNVQIRQENLGRYYNGKGIKRFFAKVVFSIKRDCYYFRNLAILFYKRDRKNIQGGISLIKRECLFPTKILVILVDWFHKKADTNSVLVLLKRLVVKFVCALWKIKVKRKYRHRNKR